MTDVGYDGVDTVAGGKTSPLPSGVKDARFADPFAGKARSSTSAPSTPVEGKGRIPGEAGIWFLIFGDLLIFSLFFIVFIVERSGNLALFQQAHAQMSLAFGTVNTLVLLAGSMFVVLGIHSAIHGRSIVAGRMILMAFVTGIVFAGSKAMEYAGKIEQGLTPLANEFYMYYFVFTGIHLVHVVIAMMGLLLMYRIVRRPKLSVRDVRVIEAIGCFWHLVDLLWIALFALLYLVR